VRTWWRQSGYVPRGGRYWHHARPQAPATEACKPAFQDQLSIKLAELTGLSLF